jgi:hypothetical protein
MSQMAVFVVVARGSQNRWWVRVSGIATSSDAVKESPVLGGSFDTGLTPHPSSRR